MFTIRFGARAGLPLLGVLVLVGSAQATATKDAALSAHHAGLLEASQSIGEPGLRQLRTMRMRHNDTPTEGKVIHQTTVPVFRSVAVNPERNIEQTILLEPARSRARVIERQGERTVRAAAHTGHSAMGLERSAIGGSETATKQRVERLGFSSYRFRGTAADVPAFLKGRIEAGARIGLNYRQARFTIRDGEQAVTARHPTQYEVWVAGIGTSPVTREEYRRLRDASSVSTDD